MNTFEIAFTLPRGNRLCLLIAAPSLEIAETDARNLLRGLQEKAMIFGATDILEIEYTRIVAVRETLIN